VKWFFSEEDNGEIRRNNLTNEKETSLGTKARTFFPMEKGAWRCSSCLILNESTRSTCEACLCLKSNQLDEVKSKKSTSRLNTQRNMSSSSDFALIGNRTGFNENSKNQCEIVTNEHDKNEFSPVSIKRSPTLEVRENFDGLDLSCGLPSSDASYSQLSIKTSEASMKSLERKDVRSSGSGSMINLSYEALTDLSKADTFEDFLSIATTISSTNEDELFSKQSEIIGKEWPSDQGKKHYSLEAREQSSMNFNDILTPDKDKVDERSKSLDALEQTWSSIKNRDYSSRDKIENESISKSFEALEQKWSAIKRCGVSTPLVKADKIRSESFETIDQKFYGTKGGFCTPKIFQSEKGSKTIGALERRWSGTVIKNGVIASFLEANETLEETCFGIKQKYVITPQKINNKERSERLGALEQIWSVIKDKQ